MIKERRMIMRDEILKKLIEKTAKVMRVDPSTLSENTNIKKDLNLKYTPYNTLIYFVEEALSDLVNCKYLFDFRDLE